MKNLQNIDIKLLRIFAAVVRSQGFANAQQILNMSTSAISTYMSQLEENVSMTLCNRGRGGFALTEKGEAFYRETLTLLQNLENFSLQVSQIKQQIHGTLKIGIIDSIVSDQQFPLDRIIEQYVKENPSIYLQLEVYSPYELQMGVLENRIDIAIGSFVLKINGIVYYPLHHEQHWLFCSDRHPLYHGKYLTEQQITQEKIVRRGYWSHNELAKHGFKDSFASVESMEAQLILILTGQYIGYLPEHFAQAWVDAKRLKVLLPAIFGYRAPFSVITRRGRIHESIIQKFRQLIIQYAQNHSHS